MKKHLILLLSALLLPLWGCIQEGTYTASNVEGIVTVRGTDLITDAGVQYSITEDATGETDWKVDGTRCFVIFDIINASLDIRLKYAEPLQIIELLPLDEEETYPEDPVYLEFNQLSGNHIDMGITIYKAKDSNYAHRLLFRYKEDTERKMLHLYLYHDGNDENPSIMSDKSLENETLFYTLPMDKFDVTSVDLTTFVLMNNPDGGSAIVESYTYNSR